MSNNMILIQKKNSTAIMAVPKSSFDKNKQNYYNEGWREADPKDEKVKAWLKANDFETTTKTSKTAKKEQPSKTDSAKEK